MREIKFRAWDVKYSTMDEVPDIVELCRNSIHDYGFGNGELILMQYTGLKDKNGVEIYEGDVIQKSNGDKYKVEFNEETACFVFNYFGLKITFTNSKQFEVIGNIHENP